MERQREIKIRVWDGKEMSEGMVLPMLAGWLYAKYPHLGNEVYLEFTGLRDKNGAEVFEGDTFASGTIALKNWHVQWIDHWGKFCLVSHRRMTGKVIFNSIQRVPKMEIVGNIYKKD